MAGDSDSLWFTYLLNPSRLATDLAAQPRVEELQPLLRDLITNLLNTQQAGLFTDNCQELWFAKTRERKCLVLRNLSLQVAAHLSWRLSSLELILPPPLLLYLLTALVQAQPDQAPPGHLANTAAHTELHLPTLATPGPTLQALTLLHRWVVRTFMTIRTPAKQERSSTVMVPGVKRDPAILYRDQTHTLVSAVAPTSIKFLEMVVTSSTSPTSQPGSCAFPTSGLGVEEVGYSVQAWGEGTLTPVDRNLFLASAAYDLGCCYFFCEDYTRARTSFSSHFTWRGEGEGSLGGEVSPARLAGYCTCLGLTAPSPPPPSLPALLATSDPSSLASVLSEDTLKGDGRTRDGSGRECAELSLGMAGRGGREAVVGVTLLNLVARSLRGLPLCLRTRRFLAKLPTAGLQLLQEHLSSLLTTSSPRDQRLLRCLVRCTCTCTQG